MAAKDQPGKSTKMVWRSCLKCSTRLSELCYDTHTLCEACRNKVCDLNSFCEECESWTPEFRKLYVRNKRTLYLKRVSKKNAKSKAKSPPQVDDAASTASQESLVSPPVVILPLDPQLVDSELSLAELGNIQTVDNVVEVQFQQPPPPASVPFNAGLMNSAFEKINDMMEVFKEFRPLLRKHLGSARRSPTAGPSDIDRPNPLDKVSDMAPQGPVMAPRALIWLLDPPRLRMTLMPWVLADMMHLAMTCSFLHVVEWTGESMCLMGVAMCRLLHPLRTRNVSGMNWRESTPKFPR